MEDHVPRHAQMGAWVLINDRWYYIAHDVKADCRRVAVPLFSHGEIGQARVDSPDRSLSFRPLMNAGELVKACFADRVLSCG